MNDVSESSTSNFDPIFMSSDSKAVLFTTKVAPPPELARFHIGLWEEEELFDRHEGWEFLIRSSFILEDEHPDGSRHRHPINKILARKPG